MCRECLYEISKRLRGSEVLILYSLKDTTAQTGLVMEDIIEETNAKRHRVYYSLDKLYLVGAVDFTLEDRFHRYYITDDGLEILEILDNE